MAEPASKKKRLTLRAAQEIIAGLEAELAAAQKTVRVLLDKAERSDNPAPHAAMFVAAARMEQLIAERTREAEEKGVALASVNSELRALTDNLDQIVRARTRALAASEEQLRENNEELQRLNKMKSDFIAISAHELRTPLTSIVGYHDLMLEGKFGELSSKLQRPMRSLQRNSHRLKRLVDEMLDLSRIEAGKVSLYFVRVDIASLVDNVVQELKPLATAKRQKLDVESHPAPHLRADPDKVHQVVANLVANAIRYTPEEGRIVVITDEAPQDRYAGAWLRIRVRDNGIGIPDHLQSRIFEPFSDVTPVKHHTSSGPDSAGLGLYIARGLVDLHGGLITVDSREGEGTEFSVLLPVAGPDAADVTPT